MNWNELDRVLLVGGSTRMPMVRSMLNKLTGIEPDETVDPDQIVARGAAMFAAIRATQDPESDYEFSENLRVQLQNVVVRDVNSHSLGVQAQDRKTRKKLNSILIPKNTKLPFAASRVFYTPREDAKRVTVRVLEGEAPEAEANILLGECRVTDLPKNLPERSPIQVRLSYGSNGRVSIMALDMTGGGLAHVEIERKSGLSNEDIERERSFVDSLRIQ